MWSEKGQIILLIQAIKNIEIYLIANSLLAILTLPHHSLSSHSLPYMSTTLFHPFNLPSYSLSQIADPPHYSPLLLILFSTLSLHTQPLTNLHPSTYFPSFTNPFKYLRTIFLPTHSSSILSLSSSFSTLSHNHSLSYIIFPHSPFSQSLLTHTYTYYILFSPLTFSTQTVSSLIYPPHTLYLPYTLFLLTHTLHPLPTH